MDIYQILEAMKFAGQAVGQKPGDQVRGTEVAKPTKSGAHPFKGRLVGASESVEMECGAPMTLADKLRARWEETKREKGLNEVGMTTGGMAGMTGGNPTNPVDAQKTGQELAQAQQNANKLKSAGVNVPATTGQVAKTSVATNTNPTSPMDSTSKKITSALGQELEKLLATGNQNQINQAVNAFKQAKLNT